MLKKRRRKRGHARPPTIRERIIRERLAQQIGLEMRKRLGLPPGRYWPFLLGRIREELFEQALEAMKGRGEIIDFVKTSPGGASDVHRGIDYYVVFQLPTRRGVLPFQVTGYALLLEHSRKHPGIPVIAVERHSRLFQIQDQIRMHLSA